MMSINIIDFNFNSPGIVQHSCLPCLYMYQRFFNRSSCLILGLCVLIKSRARRPPVILVCCVWVTDISLDTNNILHFAIKLIIDLNMTLKQTQCDGQRVAILVIRKTNSERRISILAFSVSKEYNEWCRQTPISMLRIVNNILINCNNSG